VRTSSVLLCAIVLWRNAAYYHSHDSRRRFPWCFQDFVCADIAACSSETPDTDWNILATMHTVLHAFALIIYNEVGH